MAKKWALCVVFLVLACGQSLALEMFPELEVTAQMGRFVKAINYYPDGTRFFSKVGIDVGILRQDNLVLFTNLEYDTYFIESRRGILQWCPWFCDYTNQFGIRYQMREDLSFKLYWEHQCSHQVEQGGIPFDYIVPAYDLIVGEIKWRIR